MRKQTFARRVLDRIGTGVFVILAYGCESGDVLVERIPTCLDPLREIETWRRAEPCDQCRRIGARSFARLHGGESLQITLEDVEFGTEHTYSAALTQASDDLGFAYHGPDAVFVRVDNYSAERQASLWRLDLADETLTQVSLSFTNARLGHVDLGAERSFQLGWSDKDRTQAFEPGGFISRFDEDGEEVGRDEVVGFTPLGEMHGEGSGATGWVVASRPSGPFAGTEFLLRIAPGFAEPVALIGTYSDTNSGKRAKVALRRADGEFIVAGVDARFEDETAADPAASDPVQVLRFFSESWHGYESKWRWYEDWPGAYDIAVLDLHARENGFSAAFVASTRDSDSRLVVIDFDDESRPTCRRESSFPAPSDSFLTRGMLFDAHVAVTSGHNEESLQTFMFAYDTRM